MSTSSLLVGLTLAVACCLGAAAELKTDMGSVAVVRVASGIEITLSTDKRTVRLRTDRRFGRYLRKAERAVLVGNDVIPGKDSSVYFLLAVAMPSTEVRGPGQCGAGTEDFLLWIRWQSGSTDQPLTLSDQIPIQSCLNSLELVSDQGGDMESPLAQIENPKAFNLAWFNHPV